MKGRILMRAKVAALAGGLPCVTSATDDKGRRTNVHAEVVGDVAVWSFPDNDHNRALFLSDYKPSGIFTAEIVSPSDGFEESGESEAMAMLRTELGVATERAVAAETRVKELEQFIECLPKLPDDSADNETAKADGASTNGEGGNVPPPDADASEGKKAGSKAKK